MYIDVVTLKIMEGGKQKIDTQMVHMDLMLYQMDIPMVVILYGIIMKDR